MPARLSERTKAVRGTTRPSRRKAPAAGERLTKAPNAPDSLSPAAASEWAVLAPILVELGTLTRADLRALELLCELLASVGELEEVIRREGHTIEAASGGRKGHPAAQALATARTQAHRLLADFGLTPRARASVDQAPDVAEDDDPDERFFRDPSLARKFGF